MRILVTGADGISGRAVIRHLVARGAEVRGLLGGAGVKATIENLGATAIVGDPRDDEDMRAAMAGVARVYHICPDWEPDEVAIGEAVIAAARSADIELFGYHGTVAPHLEDVPSQWAKVRIQMALMRSGLAFSVFQPAAYMQILRRALTQAFESGVMSVPFRTDAPLTWVDADDVGTAVANVMTRPEHQGGTYELCGTAAPLTARQVAAALAGVLGREVPARTCAFADFARQPPLDGAPAASLERAEAYYDFINDYGMRAGNPHVLAMLLGRTPTTFDQFLARLFQG